MDNVELVTELRHELHAHPELSNHEVWTRRRLIDFLHAHTRNLEIVDEGKGYFYALHLPRFERDRGRACRLRCAADR